MKNFFGLISRLNTSVNLKIGQLKLLKLKHKEKNEWKQIEQNIQELWYNVEQSNIHIIEISEGEEITEQKKYLKR